MIRVKLKRVTIWAALLVALLAAVAVAAPGVALVKVTKGSATLDGKAIKPAALAAEGQTLRVEAGSSVNIQLLGSSHELKLDGATSLVVNKAKLLKGADISSRSAIDVAVDIGNRNTAAASISRITVEKDDPSETPQDWLATRPMLPPLPKDDLYVLLYEEGDEFQVPIGETLTISVKPQDGEGSELAHTFSDREPLIPISMPLQVGRGYFLEYKGTYKKLKYRYLVGFRVLTPEQQSMLVAAEAQLLEEYRENRDILPLLRMASLYQEFDQNDKVLEFLKRAYDSPYLKDESQWKSLARQVKELQDALEMAIPPRNA